MSSGRRQTEQHLPSSCCYSGQSTSRQWNIVTSLTAVPVCRIDLHVVYLPVCRLHRPLSANDIRIKPL